MEGYREKDVVRFEGHSTRRLSEPVAIEAALSIRVVSYDGVEFSLGITMRTPGQDEDLILGHCITEGVIDSAAEVQDVEILQNDAKVYLSKQSNFQPGIMSDGLLDLPLVESVVKNPFPISCICTVQL